MDTSPEYVKMCEAAKEIQYLWELHAGDYYKLTYPSNQWIHQLRAGRRKRPDSSIWLPRQDELQEMMGDFGTCLSMIDRWEQLSAVSCDYPNVTSMEQLWLAFVMHEKFNKVWNGKEWNGTEWIKS
jgi:hypothetical protein